MFCYRRCGSAPTADVIRKFVLSKSKYLEDGKGEEKTGRWNVKCTVSTIYEKVTSRSPNTLSIQAYLTEVMAFGVCKVCSVGYTSLCKKLEIQPSALWCHSLKDMALTVYCVLIWE